MNLNTTTFLWTILCCFGQAFVFSQAPFYKVNLKSKNKFIGQIVKEEEHSLTLKIADSSFVKVHEKDINDVRRLNPNNFKRGQYWDRNMHSQRYLFSSSAYTLDKGDFCYRNILGFYNGLEYGITNRLNISGGLNIYPLIIDELNTFVYNASIKYGGWRLSKKISAAFNFNISDIKDPYQSRRESEKHLSLTGLLTYGNNDNHMTVGLGAYQFKGFHYSYDFNNFFGFNEYKTNIFSTIRLNGSWRIANGLAIITENWVISNEQYSNFWSLGLRY